MLKLRKSGIDAPIPYSVDLKNNLIYMEYIEGMSVRDYIVSTNLSSEMGKFYPMLFNSIHSKIYDYNTYRKTIEFTSSQNKH